MGFGDGIIFQEFPEAVLQVITWGTFLKKSLIPPVRLYFCFGDF